MLTSTKSLPGLNHSYQYFPHINNKNTGPFQIYVIYIYIKKCSYKANICSLAHNLNTVGADFCFLAITIAMRIGFFVGLAFGGLGWRWRIGWDGGGCIDLDLDRKSPSLHLLYTVDGTDRYPAPKKPDKNTVLKNHTWSEIN